MLVSLREIAVKQIKQYFQKQENKSILNENTGMINQPPRTPIISLIISRISKMQEVNINGNIE